jgi:hypothetical protein
MDALRWIKRANSLKLEQDLPAREEAVSTPDRPIRFLPARR